MASTDIDGEPILILGRKQAETLLEMCDRIFYVFPDELALLERIRATFPPDGDRDLRLHL